MTWHNKGVIAEDDKPKVYWQDEMMHQSFTCTRNDTLKVSSRKWYSNGLLAVGNDASKFYLQ